MTARQIINRLKSEASPDWIASSAKKTASLTAFLLPTLSLIQPVTAFAQNPPALSVSGSPVSGETPLKIFTPSETGKSAKSTKGTPFSEIIRGNGSPVGYQLTHGNVQTDTLSVRAGTSRLVLNRDYFIEAGSGTLYFAAPIKSNESVSIAYRYEEASADNASKGSFPGLQFAFGGSAFNLGLTYQTSPGDGSGTQTSLYGLAFGGKSGRGSSTSYNGLAYFTNTRTSNNLVTSASLSNEEAKAPDPSTLGSDHLLVQDFGIDTGGFRLKANYQDVGKNFSGFQALKLSNSGNKTTLDQLVQLEGEKGVKRTGIGLGFSASPKNKAGGNLTLDWNQLQDGKGSIQQESLGYSSRNLNFSYSERKISDSFEKFGGLREADKAQWQREKGVKTTAMGLGFNLSANPKSPSAFAFSSQEFSDKSGSLKREQYAFNSAKFGLSMMNRKSSSAFKRLNDLSDADKTTLALDLYRQFDANAKSEQVTANDRVQVTKEAGFTRDGLRFDSTPGKNGQISYSQMSVSQSKTTDKIESEEGIKRENLSLQTSKFSLNYISRKTSSKFDRIADLSDIEKSNFALDTRRQFDPEAKIEQVTQKDRDLLAKESGFNRESLRGGFSLGKKGQVSNLFFSQFRLTESVATSTGTPSTNKKPADIEGLRANYQSKSLQISYSNQSIANRFSRFADLSDVERSQFGKTSGLQTKAITLNWQANKTTKVRFSQFTLDGTGDAITDAVQLANKNKTDSAKAALAAASGLNRLAFSLETTGFSFAANQGKTDREFTRSTDLALTDPEKLQIASEVGMKRTDYALHLDKIKGLLFDGTLYSAKDNEAHRDHNIEHTSLQYIPSKQTLLTYKSDVDTTTDKELKNGTEHKALAASKEFGKFLTFNLSHDENATFDQGKEASGSIIDYLQLETAKAKPNSASVDTKRISFFDGKYENTTNLILHSKPLPLLTLRFSRQEIEKGDNSKADASVVKKDDDVQKPGSLSVTAPIETPKTVAENTDSVDLSWQATKMFTVVFGLSQKDTTNKTDGDTLSVGLQGEPIKDVTFTCKFDEVHNDGKNTRDLADFSISNKKPIQFGLIKDLTITARYASLNDQRKLQNETMTGRASWKFLKNEFLVDYAGITKQNGEETTSRLYSFTTDPNPKNRFHGGFYYKVRSLVDGQEKIIRRFTADWKLARKFDFIYSFGTLPEDEQGNLKPLTTENIGLKHRLGRGMSAEYFYRLSDDQTTKRLTRSFGFGLEGNLDKITKLGIAYSQDTTGTGTTYDHSHHYRFLFDHQVSSDHFLTVSTEFRSHDTKELKDEIRANLDYRLVF